MDDFSIHTASLPRQFPLSIAVGSMGYMDAKKHWVEHSFSSFNFSFILAGQGRYRWQNQWLEVKAPCVITQWPAVPMHYGPEDGTWRELYFIYAPEYFPELQRMRLARHDTPIWTLPPATHKGFLSTINQTLRNWHNHADTIDADSMDRDCEAIIRASWTASESQPRDPDRQLIENIRDALIEQLNDTLKIDAWVIQFDISPSKFRRLWKTYYGIPPWRYVLNTRLQRAARMLIETRMRVSEVAYTCAFTDPLYFSRLFQRYHGVSPKKYRQHYAYTQSAMGQAYET